MCRYVVDESNDQFVHPLSTMESPEVIKGKVDETEADDGHDVRDVK